MSLKSAPSHNCKLRDSAARRMSKRWSAAHASRSLSGGREATSARAAQRKPTLQLRARLNTRYAQLQALSEVHGMMQDLRTQQRRVQERGAAAATPLAGAEPTDGVPNMDA